MQVRGGCRQSDVKNRVCSPIKFSLDSSVSWSIWAVGLDFMDSDIISPAT